MQKPYGFPCAPKFLANSAYDICFFFLLCSFIAAALKLDHSRVIDTSFIFKYSNGSIYRRPSLSKLCKVRVRCMFFIVRVISLMHSFLFFVLFFLLFFPLPAWAFICLTEHLSLIDVHLFFPL